MWSGPALATMFSVPPLTGFAVLVAVGLLAGELDDDDGELEHAARPMAAVATTASPATRLDTWVMGMFLFGLLRSGGAGQPLVMPRPRDHCLPERLCATCGEIQPKMRVVA